MRGRLWYAGFAGVLIGLLAAASQAFLQVRPPVAYGFCMVCHPATIISWSMNNYLKTDLPLSEAFLIFPSLLSVGVIIGAVVGANAHGEINWRRTPGTKKYMALLFGFLIANLALITAGCPIRLGLLVSYGSVSGAVLVLSLILGIGLASVYLKFRKESAK